MTQKTVLLVDDEEDILNLFTIILTRSDYRVLTAMDGAECLNVLERNSVDLIVLDIMMPRMNGWETLEHIIMNKTMKNKPKVLIASVAVKDEEKMDFYKEHVAGYLNKSSDILNLDKIIADII